MHGGPLNDVLTMCEVVAIFIRFRESSWLSCRQWIFRHATVCRKLRMKAVEPFKIHVFGFHEDALAEASCAYFHPLEGYAGRC